MSIIFSILSFALGCLFVGWGIYQIKTGKMVAYRAKDPIDEPREVGFVFIIVGLFFILFLSTAILNIYPALIPEYLAHLIAKITPPMMTAGTLLLAATLLVLGIYNLMVKRIFTIKIDARTKKPVEKFYKPVAISLIVISISFFLCFGAFAYTVAAPVYDATVYFVNACLVPVLAMVVVPISTIVILVSFLKINSAAKKIKSTSKKAKKVAKTRKK